MEGDVNDDGGGLDGVYALAGAAEITSGLCASMGVFVVFEDPAWFASGITAFPSSKQEYKNESRGFKIASKQSSSIVWDVC